MLRVEEHVGMLLARDAVGQLQLVDYIDIGYSIVEGSCVAAEREPRAVAEAGDAAGTGAAGRGDLQGAAGQCNVRTGQCRTTLGCKHACRVDRDGKVLQHAGSRRLQRTGIDDPRDVGIVGRRVKQRGAQHPGVGVGLGEGDRAGCGHVDLAVGGVKAGDEPGRVDTHRSGAGIDGRRGEGDGVRRPSAGGQYPVGQGQVSELGRTVRERIQHGVLGNRHVDIGGHDRVNKIVHCVGEVCEPPVGPGPAGPAAEAEIPLGVAELAGNVDRVAGVEGSARGHVFHRHEQRRTVIVQSGMDWALQAEVDRRGRPPGTVYGPDAGGGHPLLAKSPDVGQQGDAVGYASVAPEGRKGRSSGRAVLYDKGPLIGRSPRVGGDAIIELDRELGDVLLGVEEHVGMLLGRDAVGQLQLVDYIDIGYSIQDGSIIAAEREPRAIAEAGDATGADAGRGDLESATGQCDVRTGQCPATLGCKRACGNRDRSAGERVGSLEIERAVGDLETGSGVQVGRRRAVVEDPRTGSVLGDDHARHVVGIDSTVVGGCLGIEPDPRGAGIDQRAGEVDPGPGSLGGDRPGGHRQLPEVGSRHSSYLQGRIVANQDVRGGQVHRTADGIVLEVADLL